MLGGHKDAIGCHPNMLGHQRDGIGGHANWVRDHGNIWIVLNVTCWGALGLGGRPCHHNWRSCVGVGGHGYMLGHMHDL